MPMLTCPKCRQRNAVYRVEANELFVKCQCGYLKCVYSETHNTVSSEKFNPVQMPRSGSLLEKHLQVVIDSWPHDIQMGQIVEELGSGNSKAAAKSASNSLWVLAHKNLVTCTEYGNGKKGGGSWRVSEDLRRHLNLEYK